MHLSKNIVPLIHSFFLEPFIDGSLLAIHLILVSSCFLHIISALSRTYSIFKVSQRLRIQNSSVIVYNQPHISFFSELSKLPWNVSTYNMVLNLLNMEKIFFKSKVANVVEMKKASWRQYTWSVPRLTFGI